MTIIISLFAREISKDRAEIEPIERKISFLIIPIAY